MKEKREPDLKRYAPILLKTGILIAILGFIAVAIYSPPPEEKGLKIKKPLEVVRIEEIPPQLKQLAAPPPPPKPRIPVAAETEEEVEQETIEETEFTGYERIPPELEISPQEVPQFVPYDKEPELIYLPTPEYPELARKAQIEGDVVLLLRINEKGNVIGVRVKESVHPLIDEAAIKVAWRAKFKPAMQRDKPVPVMIQIIIRFKLEED